MNRSRFKPLCSLVAVAIAASAVSPACLAQDKYAALSAPAAGALVRFGAQPRAADLYAEGMDLRVAGEDRAAHDAFLKAAERGHAKAQRRLAEIYDRGNVAVARDYLLAIHWYQKAREQGEQIAQPPRRSFGAMGLGG